MPYPEYTALLRSLRLRVSRVAREREGASVDISHPNLFSKDLVARASRRSHRDEHEAGGRAGAGEGAGNGRREGTLEGGCEDERTREILARSRLGLPSWRNTRGFLYSAPLSHSLFHPTPLCFFLCRLFFFLNS